MVATEKENRGSSAPLSSVASKLATLDWPRPPSPAAGTQRPRSWAGPRNSSVEAGVGATSPQGSRRDSQAEALAAKPGSEARHRAELWAVRSDIEREKLRHVAPFPFFGKAMRFQDESGSGALQISDDGRFSYSTVTIGGLEPGERQPSGEPQVRRVITYEGILMPPPQDQGLRAFQAFRDPPVHDDGVASIEGNAMAKYEMEDSGGRAKLVSVVRGQFSFSITVSPYFQPSFCTVQPSPRKWPPARKKQLPYVGTGLDKKKRDASASAKPSLLMKAGDVRRLMQERRRYPKLKFSKSATQLAAIPGHSPLLSMASEAVIVLVLRRRAAKQRMRSPPGSARSTARPCRCKVCTTSTTQLRHALRLLARNGRSQIGRNTSFSALK
eukprot:TRINITY_DN12946_c0_g1_i5.p1 TRINITY_DN12946_c0_g1~~TRINITY_DN12946_c0_g1_i5.p1  ORF type:complete len:384 (+),score=61.11 TRINITY_DN12946_c0_g1_i5:86-1237(+)